MTEYYVVYCRNALPSISLFRSDYIVMERYDDSGHYMVGRNALRASASFDPPIDPRVSTLLDILRS